MKLDQFDKMQANIKRISDLMLQLKLENNKLRKENEQLKTQISEPMNVTNQAEQEFIILQRKQKMVTARLSGMLERVKVFLEGVD
jgi:regulator of replication initiation timing